jgi:hypothetical protein
MQTGGLYGRGRLKCLPAVFHRAGAGNHEEALIGQSYSADLDREIFSFIIAHYQTVFHF